MDQEKAFTIVFISDDRISHERTAVLTRTVQNLKRHFNVTLLKGFETTEAQFLQKLEKEPCHLVLAPLHTYQSWSRIEAFFGNNRTSGPTFAGYFCEPLPFYQLPSSDGHQRRMIFDFQNLNPSEITLLIQSLIQDHLRSGIKPLHTPTTPIYCENWFTAQGQGSRTDQVLQLPEIFKSDWSKRSSSIRIVLSAFWSLVFEEGPGKIETPSSANSSRPPKAYFQVAADSNCLSFRLLYRMPNFSIKDALKNFWPDKAIPNKAAQLLLRYSDFLRVHTFSDSADIEIVAGFLPSGPAERAHEQAHSIWIEPLSSKLLTETSEEATTPNHPQLRPLPTVSASESKLKLVHSGDGDGSRDRAMQEASNKIRDLKKKIDEREEKIRELKAGGIGTAQALPPPDAEALLEAFQQRYFDAKLQIRQFEIKILEMEKKGASPHAVHDLRLKMEALINRQKSWIKKIVSTIETQKAAAKKSNK